MVLTSISKVYLVAFFFNVIRVVFIFSRNYSFHFCEIIQKYYHSFNYLAKNITLKISTLKLIQLKKSISIIF